MKIDRQSVLDKYKGHCAYCGEPINLKNMEIDHLKPINRKITYFGRNSKGKPIYNKIIKKPELDTFENSMPSCRRCNRNKNSHTLEEFRQIILNYREQLHKTAAYTMSIKYGLIDVSENENKVTFYFENWR